MNIVTARMIVDSLCIENQLSFNDQMLHFAEHYKEYSLQERTAFKTILKETVEESEKSLI